ADVSAAAVEDVRLRAELSRRAREMAANEEWLKLLSHDVRTTLATIIGRASLISARKDDSATVHSQVILQSAWRITNLMRDLTDVSYLEAGRLTLHRTQTD